MKYLAYLFSAINLYAGVRFLLNVLGILQTSKYGQGSNIFFAVTLIGASIAALYISIARGNQSLALLVNAIPWILTILLVVGNMIFGDYR